MAALHLPATMLSTFACVLLLVLLSSCTHGFVSTTTRCHQLSRNYMISPFGGTSSNTKQDEFPKDVKDAVSKCRAAVQEALGKRLSRMDVEFPVGTKFGVEKSSSKKKQRQQGTEPTRQVSDTSDRELARLFVEMFVPVGEEHIAVIFKNENLADQARKQWKGDPSASSCRILSLEKSKKSKKKQKPRGFAAKMEAEVGNADSSGPFALPDGIEVALFVAPNMPKELLQVEKVCNMVGMATLVVLLNARLASIDNFPSKQAETLFLNQFEPVFSLCAAPQEAAPGCLLHRVYPSEWLVARKPKVGQPKVILKQADRPSEEDCKGAYDSIDVGDLEKNVEGVLENVVGWFN